ncbi:hypothetical protein AD945_00025, partial [Gluconobacter albidus]
VSGSGDVTVGPGHTIQIQPGTSDGVNGAPYFSAPAGNTLKLQDSGGTNANLGVTGSLSAETGVASGGMTLTTLNNVYRPAQDGTQMWCSDCKLNGVTGVAAFYHANGTKWTDSQNNGLTN